MSEMRVYVGTYAKYNNADLTGWWMDIDDYSDKDEFYDACKELHDDEEDPELMFQDFEGIPEGMISESHIDDEVFELATATDEEIELLTIYRKHVDSSGTLQQAQDSYRGVYDDPAHYAEQLHEGSETPEWCAGYIDWESMARDMGFNGMTFVDLGIDQCWVFA